MQTSLWKFSNEIVIAHAAAGPAVFFFFFFSFSDDSKDLSEDCIVAVDSVCADVTATRLGR